MKFRRVKNQTPQSFPPKVADGGTAGDERFVWEMLVPRLIHPGKLTIIQTLLEKGGPLSLGYLAEATEISVDHARYHCTGMERSGVLEVVGTKPRADGEGDEPSYFFLPPSRALHPDEPGS